MPTSPTCAPKAASSHRLVAKPVASVGMTGGDDGRNAADATERLTLTLDELSAIFGVDRAASGVGADDEGDPFTIIEYTSERIVGSTEIRPEHSRKGGTIAGMTTFRLFDSMAYVATLAQSPKGTEAYTSDI